MSQTAQRTLSIIIPVLNDAESLAKLLKLLAAGPQPESAMAREIEQLDPQIIVVDGGSADASCEVAREAGVTIIRANKGRGQQMHAGVAAAVSTAQNHLIWFLHADSSPNTPACLAAITQMPQFSWGSFNVTLLGNSAWLPLVSWFMNWRSHLSGISTGDQGIVCDADLLRQAGGMPVQALMEDVELSKRLRRLSRPLRLQSQLGTSARRWDEQGVGRTILQMWSFRLRYFFGTPADLLAKDYYRIAANSKEAN